MEKKEAIEKSLNEQLVEASGKLDLVQIKNLIE